MENHPIPQDVTGFQFKLIGQMTVKQFAYLAIPGVIIVIIWYLPVFALIKLALIPFLAILGLAFAFLPVEGRPLDLMTQNFLQALFTPNQYVFQKTGGTLSFLNIPAPHAITPTTTSHTRTAEDQIKKEAMLTTYLKNVSHEVRGPLDARENQFLTSVFNTNPISPTIAHPVTPSQNQPLLITTPAVEPAPLPPSPATPVVNITSPVPVATYQAPAPQQAQPEPVILSQQQEPDKKEENDTKQALSEQKLALESENALEKQALELEHELEIAKIKEATENSSQEGQQAHEKVLELDKRLQDILSEKQRLENELVQLKRQLEKGTSTKARIPSQAVDNEPSQRARKIPQSMSTRVGMPTPPDVPNLLMGIIKDSRGNVLPNILVEVKDQQGNPVRAFKTNPLGQFASATSLQNGVYTLAFEDPQGQHKFELIELTVNDQIIQPLEIISIDAREELRQQLFN